MYSIASTVITPPQSIHDCKQSASD